MRDLDLKYLAELVRRDGDKDLQAFFNIEPAKLHTELLTICLRSRQNGYGDKWSTPIMQVLDVYPSREDRNLDYKPKEWKP